MTAAVAVRSAYPPAIADLMPAAIELTKTLDGELPSRNRLMKDLHIGSDKAKAILAELVTLADRDHNVRDMHASMVRRGSTAPLIPLHLAPEPAPEPAPPAEPENFPPVPTSSTTLAENPPADPLPALAVVTEPEPVAETARRPIVWPVLILCLPAFVAIWGGWVEMGRLTGFGMVTLLPGIAHFQINTAITLPIGVETYAAYALYVWLSGMVTGPALKFAKWSALASLALGALGQVAYHLMAAAGWQHAPWQITAAVSCIPVAVLGMGAGLAHLMHRFH